MSWGADSGFITVKSRRNKPRQRIAPVSGQHTHTFRRKRARSLPLWKEQNELCASLSITLALPVRKQPLKMSSLTASKKEWIPPDATLYQHVCGGPKQWRFLSINSRSKLSWPAISGLILSSVELGRNFRRLDQRSTSHRALSSLLPTTNNGCPVPCQCS